jgi:hypothetical protein
MHFENFPTRKIIPVCIFTNDVWDLKCFYFSMPQSMVDGQVLFHLFFFSSALKCLSKVFIVSIYKLLFDHNYINIFMFITIISNDVIILVVVMTASFAKPVLLFSCISSLNPHNPARYMHLLFSLKWHKFIKFNDPSKSHSQ